MNDGTQDSWLERYEAACGRLYEAYEAQEKAQAEVEALEDEAQRYYQDEPEKWLCWNCEREVKPNTQFCSQACFDEIAVPLS